jgi:hypothetical protein
MENSGAAGQNARLGNKVAIWGNLAISTTPISMITQ